MGGSLDMVRAILKEEGFAGLFAGTMVSRGDETEEREGDAAAWSREVWQVAMEADVMERGLIFVLGVPRRGFAGKVVRHVRWDEMG